MSVQERLAQRCNELEERIAALETLEATMAHIFGWDGTVWRKLPLVWGYSDRWAENLGGEMGADGTYEQYSVAVPPGYVYQLQALMMRNTSGARGAANLYAYDGAVLRILKRVAAPVQYEPVIFSSPITLKAGDKVNVVQLSCLDNDVLEAFAWGYKMKITE